MINMIEGRPGAGKTFEAVKFHVLPAIKEGRKVITNIPINIEYVRKVLGGEAAELVEVRDFDYANFKAGAAAFPFSKPEDYADEWRNEKGQSPLYVIDECHFSLPKGGTLPEVKKFYTMARHHGVDILLLTQHPRQVDADIMGLVEMLHRCVKNTALGSSKTYLKKTKQGYRGDVVDTTTRKYDKSIFPFYKSHTASQKSINEAGASDVKNFFRRPLFYFGGGCILLGVFGLFNTDNPMDVQTYVKTEAQTETQTETPSYSDPAAARAEVINQKMRSQSSLQTSRSETVNKPVDVPDMPFQKYQMHIAGEYTAGAYGSEHNMYFAVSRNGVVLFNIDLRELVLAGYTVKRVSECHVIIINGAYNRRLYCDVPTVHYGVPAGVQKSAEEGAPLAG